MYTWRYLCQPEWRQTIKILIMWPTLVLLVILFFFKKISSHEYFYDSSFYALENDESNYNLNTSNEKNLGNGIRSRLVTAENYKKRSNRFCKKASNSGKYLSLKEAKDECNKRVDCIAIQDGKCDNKGTFKICSGNNPMSTKMSSKGTCIFLKKGIQFIGYLCYNVWSITLNNLVLNVVLHCR